MRVHDDILDLVALWSRHRDSGRPISVDELCRDRPELRQEVRAGIEKLGKMRWLEEPDPAEEEAFLTLPNMEVAVGTPNDLVNVRGARFDEFRRRLLESGLVSASRLEEMERHLESSGRVPSSSDLASELLARRHLTRFQVDEILAGRGRELVLGNYVILDKLGKGGMGQVFRAHHRRMDRLVALKVLSNAQLKTPASLSRFQREAKAAARLTHPNIVTAYDADEALGTHFLVMELVEGADLRVIVKKNGPLGIAQAIDCILQAANGLAYAHEQGIVHRDIKPANLLVDCQGRVRILDMGLARFATSARDEFSSGELTQEGAVLGTVDYMAPEQAVSTHAADERSDIYSLGCTLFFLLTGRPPYAGETLLGRMLAHRDEPVPRLVEVRADAPVCLGEILDRSLAKLPAERFANMRSFIRELDACRRVSTDSQAAITSAGLGSLVAPVLVESAANRETSSVMLQETREQQLHSELDPAPVASTPESVAVVSSVSCEVNPDGRRATTEERVADSRGDVSKRRRFALAVTLVLSGILVLAGILYRIQTDYGTIVVEVDDQQVEAVLKKDGLTIRDLRSGRTWKLKPDSSAKPVPSGEYELEGGKNLLLTVTDGDGAEFKTHEFTIKRGDSLTVRVRLEPRMATHESPAAEGRQDPGATAPTSRSPLDELDPAKIPEDERFPWQPKELVAIVGTHRQRHWNGTTSSLGLSVDGTRLISTTPHEAFVWDAQTLDRLASFWQPVGPQVAITSDNLTMIVPGNPVQICSMTAKEPIELTRIPRSGVAVQFAPGDKLFALGEAKGALALWAWDGRQAVEKKSLAGHTQAVWTVLFSPDGQMLVSSAHDGPLENSELLVWDLAAQEPRIAQRVTGCRWPLLSRDGSTLVAQCAEGAKIWDVVGSELKERGTVHATPLALSSDGTRFLSTFAATGHAFYSTNPALSEPLSVLQRQFQFRQATLSNDGATILATIVSGTVIKLTQQNGEWTETSPPVAAGSQVPPSFYADGNWLVSGSMLAELNGPAPAVASMPPPSPGFKWDLMSSSTAGARRSLAYHGSIWWWIDLSGNEPSYTQLPMIPSALSHRHGYITLSPDEREFAWSTIDQQIEVGQIEKIHAGHFSSLEHDPDVHVSHTIRFLPDGRGIVTATSDGKLNLWRRTADGWKRVDTVNPAETSGAFDVSPDGRFIAVGSLGTDTAGVSSSSLTVFEIGETSLNEHKRIAVDAFFHINSVAWFPQGDQVAIGSHKGQLAVVRIADGQVAWNTPLRGSLSDALRVAPDGRHVAVRSWAGPVYILRLPFAPSPMAPTTVRKGRADWEAARWALELGGRVELIVNEDYFELERLDELPVGGEVRLQGIDLPKEAVIAISDLARLDGLAGLRTLSLYGQPLGDEIGQPLARLTSLEQLSLGRTRITDAVLDQIVRLPKLAALRLGETSISDEGLRRLTVLTNLRHLDVRQTQVSAVGIAELQKAVPECSIRWDSAP